MTLRLFKFTVHGLAITNASYKLLWEQTEGDVVLSEAFHRIYC